MSGDVQPRKRKDKRRKKEEGLEEPVPLEEPEVKEHGTGGNVCSKIIFFILLLILGVLVGIIFIEYKGSSKGVDTPVSQSRFAGVFEGLVDETAPEHKEAPIPPSEEEDLGLLQEEAELEDWKSIFKDDVETTEDAEEHVKELEPEESEISATDDLAKAEESGELADEEQQQAETSQEQSESAAATPEVVEEQASETVVAKKPTQETAPVVPEEEHKFEKVEQKPDVEKLDILDKIPDSEELTSELESAILEVKESVLEPEIPVVKEQVSESEPELTEMKEEVSKSEPDMPVVKEQVSDWEPEVAEVKEQASELESEIPEMKEQVSELETEIPEVKEQVSESESELLEMKEGVSKSEPDMPVVKEQLSDWEPKIPEVKKQASELEPEMPEGKEQVSELEPEIPEMKEQESELELDLPEVEEQVSELESDIPEMKEQVSELPELKEPVQEQLETIAQEPESRKPEKETEWLEVTTEQPEEAKLVQDHTVVPSKEWEEGPSQVPQSEENVQREAMKTSGHGLKISAQRFEEEAISDMFSQLKNLEAMVKERGGEEEMKKLKSMEEQVKVVLAQRADGNSDEMLEKLHQLHMEIDDILYPDEDEEVGYRIEEGVTMGRESEEEKVNIPLHTKGKNAMINQSEGIAEVEEEQNIVVEDTDGESHKSTPDITFGEYIGDIPIKTGDWLEHETDMKPNIESTLETQMHDADHSKDKPFVNLSEERMEEVVEREAETTGDKLAAVLDADAEEVQMPGRDGRETEEKNAEEKIQVSFEDSMKTEETTPEDDRETEKSAKDVENILKAAVEDGSKEPVTATEDSREEPLEVAEDEEEPLEITEDVEEPLEIAEDEEEPLETVEDHRKEKQEAFEGSEKLGKVEGSREEVRETAEKGREKGEETDKNNGKKLVENEEDSIENLLEETSDEGVGQNEETADVPLFEESTQVSPVREQARQRRVEVDMEEEGEEGSSRAAYQSHEGQGEHTDGTDGVVQAEDSPVKNMQQQPAYEEEGEVEHITASPDLGEQPSVEEEQVPATSSDISEEESEAETDEEESEEKKGGERVAKKPAAEQVYHKADITNAEDFQIHQELDEADDFFDKHGDDDDLF